MSSSQLVQNLDLACSGLLLGSSITRNLFPIMYTLALNMYMQAQEQVLSSRGRDDFQFARVATVQEIVDQVLDFDVKTILAR